MSSIATLVQRTFGGAPLALAPLNATSLRDQAYALLKTKVEDARRRGIKVVSLHASKFGKPLYERNGFELSSEMILRLDGE